MRAKTRSVISRFAALAVCLAAPLLGADARAQDADCVACHEPVASVAHGSLDCTNCHSEIGDYPHAEGTLVDIQGDAGCATCHDVPVELAGSVHEGLSCSTCHAPAHEIAAPDDTSCGACHDASADIVGESVHGGIASCQGCHGDPHRVVPVSESASPVSPLRQVQSCGACHGGEDLEGYLGSSHARALMVKGLVGAPSCGGCHGTHDIWPRDDERSSFSPEHVPETCGSCHKYVLETWREKSAHGTAWKAGDAGPICTTCHESHHVMPPDVGDARLKFPEDCGGCHGARYESYGGSFHGEATDLGMLTTATCSDCHTPHANLPASDERSSVHPANLAATCGACHGEVSARFLSFDVHSDPSSRDGSGHPAVRWTYLLMTGLLVSVFVFFGIHDVLWLQRSIVALARGEISRVRHAPREGRWIRRFRPLHMWVHVVIIVTFLVLAATGLPLKFHYTEWARMLARVLGGVELARMLHRLAALLTFGYAAFHLAYIVRKLYVHRDRSILWGWRSLMPQPRDVVELFSHLRWFLYLGPRPKFDRWTYWEKFDYFAVFWGVAIIGASGLALWFPDVFTLFLPGWMLNVAFVIHSDEALLATGFIFVFHFFHSHLRPENFPLDPVMFVGAVPLERFREERPLEYEHLVSDGRLDEFLVPAPGRLEMRRAYWFGTIALVIGLLLAYGILYGLLTH